MTFLDFLVLTLACGQVVDTWRGSELFADRRARAEAGAAAYHAGDRRYRRAAILNCPFCLSHWVPLAGVLMLGIATLCDGMIDTIPTSPPWHLVGRIVGWLYRLPVYSLALTRAGWLLNGLLPARLRYGAAAEPGPPIAASAPAPSEPWVMNYPGLISGEDLRDMLATPVMHPMARG